MQIREVALKIRLVGVPSQSVNARSRIPLQFAERLSQEIGADVVEQRREPLLLPLPCYFPYALQRL
jgi:hypothetical protein